MDSRKRKWSLARLIKLIYFRSTGYSYTNLGRLFLRLFIGIMLMQFGIIQWADFELLRYHFPSIMGMGSEATLIIMICIEIVCSAFIMFGFLTRLMTLAPFISMILAEYNLLTNSQEPSYNIDYLQPGYLPIMFMGVYFFFLLVGPGKISVDYFLSLYIIHNENKSEGELEEV